MVTKAGDMRRWDGFLRRAGAVASNAIFLEQRGRLAHLLDGSQAARTKAQADATAAAAARAFADQSRSRAKIARSDAPRAFAALTASRERVLRLEADFDRSNSAVEQARTSLAAIASEVVQAQALFDVTQDLLAALPARGDDAQISELESKVAALRGNANAAQSNLAVAQGQLSSRVARRNTIASDIAAWTKRNAQASTRLTALATELSSAQRRKADASQAPDDIELRRRDIVAQIPTAQSRKAAADDALAQLEAAIRAKRERARVTQNILADCREARALAQTRHQSEVTRLSELQDDIRRALQLSPQDCEAKARDVLGPNFDTLTLSAGESRLPKLLYDRDALGGVNLRAEEEVGEQEGRLTALIADKEDLHAAVAKLRGGVDQINAEGKTRLVAAFDAVHKHFKILFAALFDGGVAELQLTDSDDPLGGGLEVYACPPGKKLQSLTLMSGGEQALTASALIFAVFLSNPSPICVLDEVDAPLDDSNVDRYCRLLNEMRERTQTRFIIITHHPITMARMDRLFGVTMAERGVSQVVSVDLTRAEALIANA